MKLWTDKTLTRKERKKINSRNYLLDKESFLDAYEEYGEGDFMKYSVYLESEDLSKSKDELTKEYSLLLTGTDLLKDFKIERFLKMAYNTDLLICEVSFNAKEYLNKYK